MSAPILYESHCHTPLCHHATGEPEKYAAAAEERGLKGVIITCHSPLPGGLFSGRRMTPEEFPHYVEMVARATEAWKGRVDVRLGLESDYYPGLEPWLEKLHARAPLHHVLGSIHFHIPNYRKIYDLGDHFAYQQVYFDHLAMAAESGLFDTLAHPDLIKIDAPAEWIFSRIEPFIARALDRIAATGVAMELNTSGVNKILPEMNPGLAQLQLMRERNIPVVLGADAHSPTRVGDRYDEALGLLDQVGYDEVSFFLDRQRKTIPLATARKSLSKEAATL